jgi:hypothetical protein
MHLYWITPDGAYYEGQFVADGSAEVTQRPSPLHIWQDGEWVEGPAPVPESISRSQFWQQVEAQSLTAAANQLIDGLTDPLQKIRAREVTTYVRTDAQLIEMATALGMDSDEIDEFFRQGGAR